MIKRDELFITEGVTQSDRYLHTPGSFAKQNLLYVQEVGRLKSLTPHKCIRKKLDSFLFMTVLSGTGFVTVDGKEYSIKQGDCAFINCMGHYEHISSKEDAWELAWIHFNGHSAAAFHELFYKYNQECSIICGTNKDRWNDIIGSLLDRQQDKSIIAELECSELLLHLLNSIIECVASWERISRDRLSEEQTDKIVLNQEELAKKGESTWCNLIREYINEEYVSSNITELLSTTYDVPYEEIDRKFIKFYGISLAEYVINRRFNAAKELLRFSIKPIEEVAMESGLGDIVTMQQMFREKESMSAEEYRKKWAQWIK